MIGFGFGGCPCCLSLVHGEVAHCSESGRHCWSHGSLYPSEQQAEQRFVYAFRNVPTPGCFPIEAGVEEPEVDFGSREGFQCGTLYPDPGHCADFEPAWLESRQDGVHVMYQGSTESLQPPEDGEDCLGGIELYAFEPLWFEIDELVFLDFEIVPEGESD